MATGTAATVARKLHQDVVHYVTCPIVYTTLTYNVGVLPAGALVVDGWVHVTTGFAGGTPQTIRDLDREHVQALYEALGRVVEVQNEARAKRVS